MITSKQIFQSKEKGEELIVMHFPHLSLYDYRVIIGRGDKIIDIPADNLRRIMRVVNKNMKEVK
jgi:hypothetical protein